jgi:DNA-binding NarL/FixJ family response regulator
MTINIQPASNERPMLDKDTKIKILVADDHFMVRDGIKIVIHNNFTNTEILEADNGEDVLNIASDNPDIAIFIIDYYMPNCRGTELLTRLKNTFPATPVIFISSTEEYGLMKAIIDKGASGFIPKSTSPQIIVQAINLALAGGTYIPKTLLESAQHHGTSLNKPKTGLTNRQLQVLHLIANGLTDKEIASKLDVSHHTVKAHTTCARNLLGAKTRTMAVENARKLGLIE